MSVCTKCNIDKEENQFQKYFHSTQQKWRVRKECSDCYYLTRLKRKNPDKYYMDNPNYKKCRTCNIWKEKIYYYTSTGNGHTTFLDCKECLQLKEREKARVERLEYLAENGGSSRVISKCNQYVDEYQKQATFNILIALGWTFNEEKGVWWKAGIKDENKNWTNLKKYIRYPLKQLEHKILNQSKLGQPLHEANKYAAEIYDLHQSGLSLYNIGLRYKASAPTISKIIKKYEQC